MARLPRLDLVGAPQHLIQRGNNRQGCFASDEDFAAYANWLKEYADKFSVDLHAWVLMTNHVHILCTPNRPKAISQMMQGLGRQYVRYFNHVYKRTGTLWEGRYKACLVQEEDYLLHLYRYIELDLCHAHTSYVGLGRTPTERQNEYRKLFKYHVEGELLTNIRQSVNKGLALGNERFKEEIEQLTGRKMQEGKRGRPVGWRRNG